VKQAFLRLSSHLPWFKKANLFVFTSRVLEWRHFIINRQQKIYDNQIQQIV
jgi:hypothetical protein